MASPTPICRTEKQFHYADEKLKARALFLTVYITDGNVSAMVDGMDKFVTQTALTNNMGSALSQ